MAITYFDREWSAPHDFLYDFSTWCHEARDNIAAACRHVAAFDTVIQAGGHIGVWPWLLAKRFARVLTFEPDVENHACAVVNLQDCASTVQLRPEILGERIGSAQWHRATDAGGHRVAADGSAGTREMITIDSLELSACDLICLDVEGYEPFVLMGAAATIARHRPVIMVEQRGHESFHGLAGYSTTGALLNLAYQHVASSHYDRVYAPVAP